MSNQLVGIIFVLLSVCLESIGQLCLKKGATKDGVALMKKAFMLSGLALFAVEALTWTLALHKIDVSMAYPMSSLSFVVIALISRLFLKEQVTKERWLGIALIICGTTTVGMS